MVIADFDNIFGSLGTNGYKIFGKLSGGEEKAIRIIQERKYKNLFTIEVTTSKDA